MVITIIIKGHILPVNNVLDNTLYRKTYINVFLKLV